MTFWTLFETHNKIFLPNSHSSTINANVIWMANPPRIVGGLIDFLPLDNRKAIPRTMNTPKMPHNKFTTSPHRYIFYQKIKQIICLTPLSSDILPNLKREVNGYRVTK